MLLIISVFSLAFFNLGTNWSIRKKYFKKISFSKMSNSITLNSSRVVFGFLNWGSFGLILSFVLSLMVGASFFVYDFITLKFISKSSLNRLKTRVLSREYKNFPLASLPHSLSDHARDLFIGIIIIELFSESIFGSFDHTYKMLRIPAMLIGASLSQVFFNHISGKFNDGESILPLFKKIIGYLGLFSLIPFTVVYFFGTELFTFVFGEQWAVSGRLSEIMAPWLMLNFIVTPLSTIPLVFNKQKSFFLISILTSALQVAGFLILPYVLLKNDAQLFLVFEIVTWTQVIMNILILYYLYDVVRRQKLKS
jgi:O-antigen/teichoic acid export membrane protein